MCRACASAHRRAGRSERNASRSGQCRQSAIQAVTSSGKCPDRETFLSERPARRWAEAHARHTGHALELRHGDDEPAVIKSDKDRY